MVEPLGSPYISPSPSNIEGSPQGVHPKISMSLEDQGFELGIIQSIQPLASCPPPQESSSFKYDPETLEVPQRFLLFPLNPLFDPLFISPQRTYSSFDNPNVPLESSPSTLWISPKPFPLMASEGEIPTSPQDSPHEVSATHTPGIGDEFEYKLPPEGFLYMGSMPPPPPPESGEPLFPLGYTSFVQLVSSTPSVSSLYHNPIWLLGAMPTSGPFVSSVASQIPIQTAVSSVHVQPKITVGTVNVLIGSSSPPLSGQYVPPPIPLHGGKQPPPPYVPLVSGVTYVSGSQTHTTGVSQTVGSVPYLGGSSIPSGSSQILYRQPLSTQIPYQQP